MVKAYMNIKTSIDELSKQLQNNFPETQNVNNSDDNKSNIDTYINDNNPTKPKPQKDQLNNIQPQYKICVQIKENSQQSNQCKDNYKLSIDKNIECITSFCSECCSKQSPAIEMKDCNNLCNNAHSISQSDQDQDKELSQLCSKDQIVSKNIDFCKIVKDSASPSPSTSQSQFKQSGDLNDETYNKCIDRLCDDCCDKELNHSDSNDKYYISCRESCYKYSRSYSINNQLVSNLNKVGQIGDDTVEIKQGIKQSYDKLNQLIHRSDANEQELDGTGEKKEKESENMRSLQSIHRLNDQLKSQVNGKDHDQFDSQLRQVEVDKGQGKGRIKTFKFKNLNDLKIDKSIKIHINNLDSNKTNDKNDQQKEKTKPDYSIVENNSVIDDNLIHPSVSFRSLENNKAIKTNSVRSNDITIPTPSQNYQTSISNSTNENYPANQINPTNQLINIIPTPKLINLDGNTHLVNDLSKLVCKQDSTKHMNFCLRDKKDNPFDSCLDSYCDTCCTRFQNATSEVIIQKPCYDNCTANQPTGIDIISVLQDSIFSVCFSGKFDCVEQKCGRLCDIKGFNQWYQSNDECSKKCNETIKDKFEIKFNDKNNEAKIKGTDEKNFDIDTVLSVQSTIHDVSEYKKDSNLDFDSKNNNIKNDKIKIVENIKDIDNEKLDKLNDLEFQNMINNQDDRLNQLKSMVGKVEFSMLDLIKRREAKNHNLQNKSLVNNLNNNQASKVYNDRNKQLNNNDRLSSTYQNNEKININKNQKDDDMNENLLKNKSNLENDLTSEDDMQS